MFLLSTKYLKYKLHLKLIFAAFYLNVNSSIFTIISRGKKVTAIFIRKCFVFKSTGSLFFIIIAYVFYSKLNS